jgi:hypothetical protein
MPRAITAATAVVVACAALSGCTVTVGQPDQSGAPKVPKAHLQKDISQRVASAGQAPQAVTPPNDLVGVGSSTWFR